MELPLQATNFLLKITACTRPNSIIKEKQWKNSVLLGLQH